MYKFDYWHKHVLYGVLYFLPTCVIDIYRAMEGCWPARGSRLQLCLDSLCIRRRRATRCSHARQQKGTEAVVQSTAVAVMEHGMCMSVGMMVAWVHMRVHVMDMMVTSATLATQTIGP